MTNNPNFPRPEFIPITKETIEENKINSYLISYEYKERNGSLINVKTDSIVINVMNSEEFNSILNNIKNKSYDKYLKILFCQQIK